MRRLLKKRKTLNFEAYRWHRQGLENDVVELDCERERQIASLTGDGKGGFFEEGLGFTPYQYQRELEDLYEKFQFLWVRWCRQSGKSFTVSGILLKDGWKHPDLYIGIVGPSWRQTKLKRANIPHSI